MNETQGLSKEQFEDLKEILNEFVDAVRQFMLELHKLWGRFVEELRKVFAPCRKKIKEIYILLLRLKSMKLLMDWYIPEWLAFRISNLIPQRILFMVVS